MHDRVRALVSPAPDLAKVWSAYPSTGRGYGFFVGLSLALTVLLAWGSTERLAAPAFATVRLTGGKWVWAAIWLGSALLLLGARRLGIRAAQHALRGVATLHLLWSFGFAGAALAHPQASWIGAVLFAVLALMCVSCADSHRVEARYLSLHTPVGAR